VESLLRSVIETTLKRMVVSVINSTVTQKTYAVLSGQKSDSHKRKLNSIFAQPVSSMLFEELKFLIDLSEVILLDKLAGGQA